MPPGGDDNLFLKTQVEKCSHSCENTGRVSAPGLCSKAPNVDGAGVEVQGSEGGLVETGPEAPSRAQLYTLPWLVR